MLDYITPLASLHLKLDVFCGVTRVSRRKWRIVINKSYDA